ncbi:hypothetical protein GGS20DRAFT_128250 [Poronia punctata]|nr:hypothetical protein GGS20DRAFT_128250 [Poronia punctata]
MKALFIEPTAPEPTSVLPMAADDLVDMTLRAVSSPEPENQRGRKRCRDFFESSTGRDESAVCRGRCRYRSTSRYLDVSSLSRSSSQHLLLQGFRRRDKSASLSPSRRKMLRILQLNGARRRSQSPSRSRSPHFSLVQDTPKRRRQRTRSRSRPHPRMPADFDVLPHTDTVGVMAVEAATLAPTTSEITVPNDISTVKGILQAEVIDIFPIGGDVIGDEHTA